MTWYICPEQDLNKISSAQFREVPKRDWQTDIGLFVSIVLIPTRYKHDSGYGCIDMVAVKYEDKQLKWVRLGGGDVVHINGIGGYGERLGAIPKLVPPSSWSIDLLYRSKFLRLHAWSKLKVGLDLSSMEIYCVKDSE
jgi:hypothetical protein